MHLHQQRKKKIYSQFLFGTLYGKARWRNPVLFKSNFLSCVFLTYIFRFSPCFSKTIYFLYLLFIYGILTMCSMLRIMSKFTMFSSHITFIIINFGSLVVKLKKAEIRYSQSHCIFLTMCPLGSISCYFFLQLCQILWYKYYTSSRRP